MSNFEFPVEEVYNEATQGANLPFGSSDMPAPVPVGSEEAIIRKAKEVHFALGKQSPGVNELSMSMASKEKDAFERYKHMEADSFTFEVRKKEQIDQFIKSRPPGQVTPEEIKILQGITQAKELSNLETYYEQKFGKEAVKRIASDPNLAELSSSGVSPFELEQKLQPTANLLAHRSFAQSLKDELDEEAKNQSWLGYGADLAADALIPGLAWYRTNDRFKDVDSKFQGSNTNEQVKAYLTENLETAGPRLREAVNSLKSQNLMMARDWLNNFISMSHSDVVIGNVMPAIGVGLELTPLGIGYDVAKAISRSTKGMAPEVIHRATGQYDKALHINTLMELQVRAGVGSAKMDLTTVPAIADPARFMADTVNPSLSPLAQARLVQMAEKNATDLTNRVVLSGSPVERMTEDATVLARQINVEDFVSRNNNLRDAVMDVVPARGEKLTNVDTINIQIGTRNANFFRSEAGAQRAAVEDYGLNPKQFTVAQDTQGPGFYINVTKDVAEKDVRMLDLDIATSKVHPWAQIARGVLQGADTQVSKELAEARKKAVYQTPMLAKAIRDNSQGLQAVRKDKQFIKFITKAHDDEVTYQSAKHMEDAWLKQFGDMPKEQHYRAYQELRIINDVDYLERNLLVRTGLVRLGVENHIIKHSVPSPEIAQSVSVRGNHLAGSIKKAYGDKLPTPANDKTELKPASTDKFFDSLPATANDNTTIQTIPEGPIQGQKIELPASANDNAFTKAEVSLQGKYLQEGPPLTSKENFSIGVWSDNGPPETIFRGDVFPQKSLDKVNDLKTQGYRTIHLTPVGQAKLREMGTFGDGPVPSYIMVKEFSSEPLPLNLLPKREGGHRMYQEGTTFVSQPNIHRSAGNVPETSYHGDLNLFNFVNKAEADLWVTRMNQARVLLKEGKTKELATFLADHTPYQSVKEFAQQFKGRGASGVFDIDQPFRARGDGESLIDSIKGARTDDGQFDLYPNLRDASSSEHNLFAQEGFLKNSQHRDTLLSSISTFDNGGKPYHSFQGAEVLDPLSALERAMDSISKSMSIEDVKIKSATEFVTAFKGVLNIPKEELARNPFKALHDPRWVEGADQTVLQAAKNHRRATLALLGVKSPDVQKLHNDLWKAYSTVIPQDGKIQKVIDIADTFMLGAVKDPVSFLRRAAFNLNMGFYNPDQFFVQSAQWINMSAIAGPQNTAAAMSAASVSRMLKFSNHSEIDSYAAKKLKAWGWSDKDFLEAHSIYMRSGFSQSDRSSSILDATRAPNVVQGPIEKFFDASTLPYRAGEQMIKDNAWFASYREWRKANPNAAMTSKIEAEILDRADTMSGNMSRANAAMWNKGIPSVGTQFLSYQARLFDELTNTKLTSAEKAKLVLANTIAWGIPVGTLGTVGGVVWPWAKTVNGYMRENGIDTDENKIAQFMNNGLLSMLGEGLTGTKFDTAGKFGPKGQEVFYSLWHQDKGVTETLLGPGGKLILDSIPAAFKAGASTIKGLVNAEESYAKDIALHDLRDAMRYIKTYDKLDQVYVYMNMASHITKAGTRLEISKEEAVSKFFFGMESSRLAEFQEMGKDLKHMRDFKAKVEKDINEVYRDYFNSLGNPGLQKQLSQRITTLQKMGGFDERERMQQRAQAVRSNGDTFFSRNLQYSKAFPQATSITQKNIREEHNRKEGIQ